MKRLALLLLLLASPAFAADTIVCGDDDNSGTQSKLKTAGLIDRDCDGNPSVTDGGTDCDDTNILINDKSYTASGCNAGFYRYCEAGVYKTGVGGSTANANGGQGCTNTTLAERGTNYYFDYGTGSNANVCSAAFPCKDFTDFNVGGSKASFGANTAFYVVGTTDWTVAPARTPDGGDGSTFVGFSTTQNGTSSGSKNIIARYPTSTAKLNYGNCDSTHECKSLKMTGAHWLVRGLEITGGYTDPIKREASDQEYFDNYIHDTPGNYVNNHSGIESFGGLSDGWMHNNIINNVYDPGRTNSGDSRENVSLITIFEGGNNIAEYNIGGFDHLPGTVPYYKQGRGIRRKHDATLGTYTQPNIIRNNVLYNLDVDCVHAVGSLDRLIGNLCVNAINGVTVSDGGNGVYYIDGIQMKNNTVVSTDHNVGAGWSGGAISFRDSLLTAFPTTAVTISGNVIDDSAQTSYSGATSMNYVYGHGNSSYLAALVTGGKLQFSNQCYYNSHQASLTTGFDVMGDSGGAGTHTDFSGWNGGTYTLETTAHNENPTFDTDMQATSTNCTGKGWVAEWPVGTTTTTTSTTTTTTLAAGTLPAAFPQN